LNAISSFLSFFLSGPRTGNDRPSQQRSDEQSSSGAWRAKTRTTTEQSDEPQDSGRSGPPSSDNRGRSDENSSWRRREITRLNRFVLI